MQPIAPVLMTSKSLTGSPCLCLDKRHCLSAKSTLPISSVFSKVFWGTKTVSQIPPTFSQNIVTWDHINGERSLKLLQAVS